MIEYAVELDQTCSNNTCPDKWKITLKYLLVN